MQRFSATVIEGFLLGWPTQWWQTRNFTVYIISYFHCRFGNADRSKTSKFPLALSFLYWTIRRENSDKFYFIGDYLLIQFVNGLLIVFFYVSNSVGFGIEFISYIWGNHLSPKWVLTLFDSLTIDLIYLLLTRIYCCFITNIERCGL